MNRTTVASLAGVASAVLLAAALHPSAQAAPTGAASNAPDSVAKSDDRPDAAAAEQRALRQKAIDMVLTGKRDVQSRGGSKSVQVSPGQWVEFEREKTDNILTMLIEFGDQVDPRFPDEGAGPAVGQIPEPDRSVDNSTYWADDFSREHFMEMFFGAGESMTSVYEELSNGKYSVSGDVSDWVQVPYNTASYGQTESNADMTRFIQDGANAWYADQVAQGKTPEEIASYLAEFDKWDRYDYDNDGNFDEPDGYIDHYQAVHAGEGEEAGAPESAIWSHRWSVNQTTNGGPEWNRFGGVRVGDTDFWIRDYTTEPENGGLGVFAHEYAHDLGLPDLYDTAGGENGTGFWTLMSSGSWLGHGGDAIGTTPNHMGAWEKLQLGWLDYAVVDFDESKSLQLGPSMHATKKPQALVVNLPPDANGNARYYIAENRQYLGDYDSTLEQGPYNFGWLNSKPNWVEHFAYQNGLSIVYWNTGVPNNQTLRHPGSGLALNIDANPTALTWANGTVARNRIQTYDATFGLERQDPLNLHMETATGATTLDLPSRPAVPVFDDSDPMAYYDPANPLGSVIVAGAGVRIEVISTTKNGKMNIQVN